MLIILIPTIKAVWELNPEYTDAKEQALAWYRHTLKADWSSPKAVKSDFYNASILQDSRVNKLSLPRNVCAFFGMHKQYDKIDAQTI